jgi:DNA polymerase elongation subunit (family B)
MEQIKQILFIDIETVSLVPDFSLLSEGLQSEWKRKAKFVKSNNPEITEAEALYNERAGIFSEFAKIVCIGFGSLHHTDDEWRLRLKSISGDNELEILTEFCEVLTKFTKHYPELRFCGHNIKEFDIPFICRRMIINGMGLPTCLQLNGKKPWEISHIDTLELWRFGDYKNFTSLSLLAEVLNIPSPKHDIDGSMVGEVYWKDKDLSRIAQYCMQDVLTAARVYLKLSGNQALDPIPVFVNED